MDSSSPPPSSATSATSSTQHNPPLGPIYSRQTSFDAEVSRISAFEDKVSELWTQDNKWANGIYNVSAFIDLFVFSYKAEYIRRQIRSDGGQWCCLRGMLGPGVVRKPGERRFSSTDKRWGAGKLKKAGCTCADR